MNMLSQNENYVDTDDDDDEEEEDEENDYDCFIMVTTALLITDEMIISLISQQTSLQPRNLTGDSSPCPYLPTA